MKKRRKLEDTDFDSLLPEEKVRLLVGILENFHKRELCIVCGNKTAREDRYMIALDGRWPDHYHNLWKHKKECGK